MVKLNLRQNALHTLHHAVEHLYWADDDSNEDGIRSFDHENHMVEWKDENGHLCFNTSEFTRPPASYNLKFALLHLIQASELLLKSYVHATDPTAIFVRAGSRRTIGLREALHFVVERNPGLLSPDEVTLLLQAKDLRNEVEHYEFHFEQRNLRRICTDFLALCSLLSEKLLHMSIVETFSWDSLRDRPDPVGDFIGSILGDASAIGRLSARKAGALWAARNPSHQVLLCLNCGARAAPIDLGTCMACGAEADERSSNLVEDLESLAQRIAELRANLGKGMEKH